jgi:Protein of unknown function (DUF1501)
MCWMYCKNFSRRSIRGAKQKTLHSNPVHLRDLHATLLHILGIDHQRFNYPFRGLDARLTGVQESQVERGILA